MNKKLKALLIVASLTTTLFASSVVAYANTTHEAGYTYMYKGFQISGSLGTYGRVYENNIQTKIVYEKGVHNNYKASISFNKPQNVGWVTLQRNDGVIDTFYTTDGTNIKVGRFSINGKQYCSDMMSGAIYRNAWVLDASGKIDINGAGNPASAGFLEHYNGDGVLTNSKLDESVGETNKEFYEEFAYNSGTTIHFGRMKSGSAYVTRAWLEGRDSQTGVLTFYNTLDMPEQYVSLDGNKLLTGLCKIQGKYYYFDRYTGRHIADVYANASGIQSTPTSDSIYCDGSNLPSNISTADVVRLDNNYLKDISEQNKQNTGGSTTTGGTTTGGATTGGSTTGGTTTGGSTTSGTTTGSSTTGGTTTGGSTSGSTNNNGSTSQNTNTNNGQNSGNSQQSNSDVNNTNKGSDSYNINNTVTGWTKVNGHWYYKTSNGSYYGGWLKDSKNRWYYLDNSTKELKTGWIRDNKGKWYFLNTNGVMATGWIKSSNKWYYLNNNGTMATGWVKYNNKWYHMDSNGAMDTGWKKVNNMWYYFNESGDMQVGWIQSGNSWYYLTSSGNMYTKDFSLGGVKYHVNESGVCGW